MSESTLATQSDVSDVPCLLLPMVGANLLVPTVTVAEMAPMKPVSDIQDSPDWFYGFYDWRDQRVPLLSFELLNGSKKVPLNPQGRVAVLNNTGVSPDLPFLAVATQGIPRMARVSPEDIREREDMHKNPFEMMHVKVGLEELVIPDVAALENVALEVIGKK